MSEFRKVTIRATGRRDTDNSGRRIIAVLTLRSARFQELVKRVSLYGKNKTRKNRIAGKGKERRVIGEYIIEHSYMRH